MYIDHDSSTHSYRLQDSQITRSHPPSCDETITYNSCFERRACAVIIEILNVGPQGIKCGWPQGLRPPQVWRSTQYLDSYCMTKYGKSAKIWGLFALLDFNGD